jgi:putative membrane protein
MIVSWLLGFALVAHLDAWGQGWMHGKFALLIAMQLVHAGFARWRRHFAQDANRHGEVFYRAMNEVPTLFMIGIVILVIVKPF